MTESYVLDSFALLALLGGEPGGDEVAGLMRQAQKGKLRLLATWVSLGEVAYLVERRWGQDQLLHVLGVLEATALEAVPAGRELALGAAHLRARFPLSSTAALAAALAMDRAASLVTGDRQLLPLADVLHILWLPRAEPARAVET